MKRKINDGVELLIRGIKLNNKFNTHACFDAFRITSKQINNLADAIANNTHLKYISFIGARFGTAKLHVLKDAFKKNNTITEVKLEHNTQNKVYENLVNEILDAVKKNKEKEDEVNDTAQFMTK